MSFATAKLALATELTLESVSNKAERGNEKQAAHLSYRNSHIHYELQSLSHEPDVLHPRRHQIK